MGRIRVALGDVHSKMLREILAQITDLEPDMQLVGPVGPPDLKEAIARERADVVICDVRPEELPDIFRELFAEPDRPVFVGLAREGREAAVCIANAGAAQLMMMIRSAVTGASDAVGTGDSRPAGLQSDTSPMPYTNDACLSDHLYALDLALLAEIDLLESTVWDESAHRLQGLVISPDEVRSLLKRSGAQRAEPPLGDLAATIEERLLATPDDPHAHPFVRLVREFNLGFFERFAVCAALAPEIDRIKYGKAYALLHDDLTRKYLSLALLVRLYGGLTNDDRWKRARVFDAASTLRQSSILRLAPREPGDPATLLERRIELDDRIARFLLGWSDLGAPLQDVASVEPWEPEHVRVLPPEDVEERLDGLVRHVDEKRPGAPARLVVHVNGCPGTGRRSLATAICKRRGLRLLRVDVARLAAMSAVEEDEAVALLRREEKLARTAACLEHLDALLEDVASGPRLRRILRAVTPYRLVFVISRQAWSPDGLFPEGVFHSVTLDIPQGQEARRIWFDELADVRLGGEITGREQVAGELAGRFALSPGQIRDAVAAARTRALWEWPERPVLDLHDLYQSCRDQCSHRLDALARRVTTSLSWSSLVLPDDQSDQLKELELAIRNSSGVLHEWDFASRLPYGRGITALFSGPSGTGKTMAASILAREIGLDLYAIDLSQAVSKYIGETEKNLDRIFRQAEDSNAMLFFDEADALFGKRSEVRDAHDRYANIEIAYLLQKMEERRGVTILATNMSANLDDAFLRRIRFKVAFSMPEYAQRLEIWRGSIPKGAPLAPDVDLPLLAKLMRISGASIVGICVSAAALAYRPGGMIAMRHMLQAAKRELQKLGQQYDERDYAPAEAALAGGRA